MKLKICGLTRKEDVELALAQGADYFGFIFVENTPRAMTLESAKELLALLPDNKHSVAVILHDDSLASKYLTEGFHYLQVIGGLVEGVSREKQIPVYSVDENDVQGLDDSGLKLFDTKVKGKLGGTGVTFDLKKIETAIKPYFVAGGFKPDNLDEVVALQPFGVDVSSGVEAEPRIKDPAKVKAFVQNLRRP